MLINRKLRPIALSSAFIFLSVPEVLAVNITPRSVSYSGPIEIKAPLMIDSVDVSNKPYTINNLLDQPFVKPSVGKFITDTEIILGGSTPELHYLSFPIINKSFAEVDVKVKGTKDFKLYLDGKECSPKLKLKPGQREITVKILTQPSASDTVSITLESKSGGESLSTEPITGGRPFTLEDVIFAPHIRNASMSPQGKYAVITETTTTPDKKTGSTNTLVDAKSFKTLGKLDRGYRWLPDRDLLWRTVNAGEGKVDIILLDPQTWKETVFAENVPDGRFQIMPGEQYLIYSTESQGPKEDADIYRVINPEDRQPGYRNRSGVAVLDLTTRLYNPLTFGNKNVWVTDMSPNGEKLLLMTSKNRFEKRPTTLFSLFECDLVTNSIDTLVYEDGFINSAVYSPDGKKVAVTGTPEALGGIANTLPAGRIPSMTEQELFIIDIPTGKITPATRDFNPSVGRVVWPVKSEQLFFTAEDKDKVSLFSYNPKSNVIRNLDVPEDIVTSFSFSDNGENGFVVGESAINPDVLHSITIKKGIPTYNKIKATADDYLEGVKLADVKAWDFVNSKGDTINGRFYLPPDFDPAKKYPMVVNYYGGCSPTSRNFATRYPHHLYANNGYVVYVINPSGATGFGQEFASRHVNTAGEGVAEDIIEGTLKFIEEHPYVDKDKIGCIGASYGGFMTQYLQTVTDLFAAAISHAGISDHTSYWGNGYWGYSYSEVSMADSYPWSDPDLYVKQSPLYNADKINTPLLFLHGDEDTNVPPGESVQLFTALKLLGKDTALVEVSGQDHHIMDIDKRTKWQDAIFAWFAKYLQDDPTWWENSFPSTSLE